MKLSPDSQHEELFRLTLSRAQLERIACNILNNYKRLPRFAGQYIHKIEPEILAREQLGCTIHYARLSQDGSILGVTSHCEVGVPIYDDSGRPEFYFLDGKTLLIERHLKVDPTQIGRHNFTLMHEIAHQILGRLFPDSDPLAAKRAFFYRDTPHQISDWGEWQADTLAAALLLPPNTVQVALFKFNLHQVRTSNQLYSSYTYKKFCAMADYLGASKQALAIRLQTLGLLKYKKLRDDKVILNIEKEDNE